MDIQAIVMDPTRAMLTRLANFLPVLVGALVVLIVGWIMARIVQEVLVKFLKTVRVDELSDRAGLEDILRKGAVGHTFSDLLGIGLYWVVLLVALLVAMNVLGLTAAAELLDRILLYVPSVLAGVIILILGSFFASLVGSVVQTISANAGVRNARALGQLTRVVLMIFAVEVALEKFIGMTTLHMQLNIVIAALAFGVALAFGLGCKDLAGQWMADLVEKLRRG